VNFKMDENMPRRAVPLLAGYGHDVATVAGEGLGGSDDPLIAQIAAQEGRMVITLDRRFADIRLHPPGHHPGILVLRLPDQSSALVEATLRSFLEQHNLNDMVGCIVVIEPGLVRVRRPGPQTQ
jgi:predicted nuclease of predicted toxin-antitoxin system